MAPRVWLIPVQPVAEQVRLFEEVLGQHLLEYIVVPPHRLLGDDEPHPRPRFAVLHGGPTSPELLDGLRTLMSFRVPTMVLVAGLTDRLESLLLDRGAQDVLALPATRERMGSRVEAMARVWGLEGREERLPSRISVADGMELLPRRRVVLVDGQDLELTKIEFDLLLQIFRHPGEIATRRQLVRSAAPKSLTTRALESHISRLRAKLRGAGAPGAVCAVRGVGYRWVADTLISERDDGTNPAGGALGSVVPRSGGSGPAASLPPRGHPV